MGTEDWYRNADWNTQIESAFFAKLRRARDKSQYLRIQACTLAEKHPHAALRLLDEYFELGDHFDMAQAYVDSATAFLALEKPSDAIASYEAALTREAEYPGLQTRAFIDLPYLIAERKIQAKFDRALELLDLYKERVKFPIDRFKWNAAGAIIQASNSNYREARSLANAALNAAAETESGFRFHPKIGLVRNKNVNSAMFRKLKKLAK